MITSTIYFCIKLGLLQLYPTYISYKAIKVNDQTQFQSLLTFWVVSITYLSIEYFSDIFLFWFPFYTEIKLTFIVWLILPQTQGASVFYTHYLDPFLQQHEENIDKTILDIQAKLKETIVLYGKQLIELLKKSISELIFKGHEIEEKAVEQPPTPPPTTSGSIVSPYHLFSSLVTATAHRIQQQREQQQQQQQQQHDTTQDEGTKLERTDSHESLQSYVNIKDTNASPELKSVATWGEYFTTWVKKPTATVTEEKKND